MRELRALTHLAWLTLRRQLTGRKTLIAVMLVGLLCLATIVWSRRHGVAADAPAIARDRATAQFTQQIILPLYVSFLLPILTLTYATAAVGEEREERTLVYVLIRPMERYRIYLSKWVGVLPLTIVTAVGGYAALCASAGISGHAAWEMFWPAIARSSIAYTALFLLFGAIFPRPVVFAVLYAFFCEAMVGNMPGTVKRATVSYYCQCLIYDTGEPLGLAPSIKAQFLPISGDAAAWALDIASLALLAVGAVAFHRKEYRDLG